MVNGGPGAIVVRDDRVLAVVGVTVSDGRISEIDIVGDPAKLKRVGAGPKRVVAVPRSTVPERVDPSSLRSMSSRSVVVRTS